MILSEYGLGVSKERLLEIYEQGTKEKFIPLIIDFEAPKEKRFRSGFKTIIPP
jgi:hypothetical protein